MAFLVLEDGILLLVSMLQVFSVNKHEVSCFLDMLTISLVISHVHISPPDFHLGYTWPPSQKACVDPRGVDQWSCLSLHHTVFYVNIRTVVPLFPHDSWWFHSKQYYWSIILTGGIFWMVDHDCLDFVELLHTDCCQSWWFFTTLDETRPSTTFSKE